MTVQFRRATALALVAGMLMVSVAPLAVAGHMTLYHTRHPLTGEPLDPGQGRVKEDDGAVVNAPDTIIHGVENQVTLNASDGIGTGAMFLDSQMYTQTQPWFVDTWYLADSALGLGPHTVGPLNFMAWYGWWNDLDNDLRINDYHDFQTPCAGCQDEFKWRGAGSNSPGIEMVLYVTSTAANSSAPAFYDDRSEDNLQQFWVANIGNPYTYNHNGILLTQNAVTIANAARDGSPLRYDVTDPAAQVDVDIYETVNPDVESMYLAALEVPGQVTAEVNRQTRDVQNVTRQIGPMVNGVAAQVSALINHVSKTINNATRNLPVLTDVIAQTTGPYVNEANRVSRDGANQSRVYNPRFLKEPNHPSDAFPGAIFDGTPDVKGIGNDYSEHEAGHHLYMDVIMRAQTVGNAFVSVEPINFAYGYYGDTIIVRFNSEPLPSCSTCDPEDRGLQPGFIGGFANIALWKDVNLDKWVGAVCNPEGSDWDPSIDECNNVGADGLSPHIWGSAAETLTVCPASTLNSAGAAGNSVPGLKVRPVAGTTWEDAGPGVRVIRFYDRLTYNVWHQDEMIAPKGTETVELEFDSCSGEGSRGTRAVDVIFMPKGSLEISLETEMTVTMTKPYRDTTNGLDIQIQTITDVDVYTASM